MEILSADAVGLLGGWHPPQLDNLIAVILHEGLAIEGSDDCLFRDLASERRWCFLVFASDEVSFHSSGISGIATADFPMIFSQR